MTPAQVAEAQRLAQQCQAQQFTESIWTKTALARHTCPRRRKTTRTEKSFLPDDVDGLHRDAVTVLFHEDATNRAELTIR